MRVIYAGIVATALVAACVIVGSAQQVVNAPNVPVFVQSKGGGVAGADTQVQFNDAGAQNGLGTFTFVKSSGSNYPALTIFRADGGCAAVRLGARNGGTNTQPMLDLSGCANDDANYAGGIVAKRLFVTGANIPVPSISSGFGTGPSIQGGDAGGRVTAGTTPGTSGVVSFGSAWPQAPTCVANNESTANLVRATATTTQLTLSGTFTAADKLTWVCTGWQ